MESESENEIKVENMFFLDSCVYFETVLLADNYDQSRKCV